MTRVVKVFVAGIKSPRTNLCRVYHWPCSLKRMPHIGGTYILGLTMTIKGLSGVPLVGGLCYVQRTFTTKGLNELPLIGGLCLVQRFSTTMAN
jgi:hypothetical protein